MIHIATCFDQNYEVPFLVLANSIETHSRSNVTIHAIDNGPVDYARATAQNLKKLNMMFYDGSGFSRKIPRHGAANRHRLSHVCIFISYSME